MNLKKHISTLLATLILVANLGLSFSVHYCKDEIASVSLQIHEEEPCIEKTTSCCAKENSHSSCCSNKIIKVEKKTDDVLVKVFQLDLDQAIFNMEWASNLVPFMPFSTSTGDAAFYCDSNAPPLYKLYCQLVFYA